MINVVKPSNLSNDFSFNLATKKIELNRNYSEYTLTCKNNVTVLDNEPARRSLRVSRGFGVIHLDFSSSFYNGDPMEIASLPANAPTPRALIEAQLFDGQTIWIPAGGRTVMGRPNRGVRYIVNLTGFFN